MSLFLLLLSSFLLMTRDSFSLQPLCHHEESSALLQLKSSFVISRHASGPTLAYPKTLSWKRHHLYDCCSWDGVECDAETGHVIGLDLSSSYLYGSITSNSTLFRLVHLQKLHLADNDFKYSRIPSEIARLTALSYLNLSHSAFSGRVPPGIWELSKLVSLDLSDNYKLQLEKPTFTRLVKNLTSLEKLGLGFVSITSSLPPQLANLSSLTHLLLYNCFLQGTFPPEIFQLPNLQVLDVGENTNLTGQLPEFLSSSRLNRLDLHSTSFFGVLPASIGNVDSLTMISIGDSEFGGPVPSSLGNLTKLAILNLGESEFIGPIPSSLANLTQLTYLSFSNNNNLRHSNHAWLSGHPKLVTLRLQSTNLVGGFPSAIRNLTQVTKLGLSGNQLTGPIPSWLSNVTQLAILDLANNRLHSPIPRSISKLYNLQDLYLGGNDFAETLGVEVFSNMTELEFLDLGESKLSLVTNGNITLPKLNVLGLGRCDLREFPAFIQKLDALVYLDLARNNIHGAIPEWIWEANRNIQFLKLDFNAFVGPINSSLLQQLSNLQFLGLKDNKLQGDLPIPSSSVRVYVISHNMLLLCGSVNQIGARS